MMSCILLNFQQVYIFRLSKTLQHLFNIKFDSGRTIELGTMAIKLSTSKSCSKRIGHM
jgi:hypothetical protein